MAVDVDKQVRTTFTVVDRATANTRRLAQMMSGAGKSAVQARRQIQSFGKSATAMGQRMSGATKRVNASVGSINRAGMAMRRYNQAAGRVRTTTRRQTAAQQRATRSIQRTGRAARGTAGAFRLLAAAGTAYLAAMSIRKIAQIGSEFEQNRIVIAGYLQTFNLAKDFNVGLAASAAVMEKIRIAAAALPGEAREYIQVFRLGLPTVQAAIPGTLSDMLQFTNIYTAAAKSFGVDAAQAGRDLAMMLSLTGRAGTEVKTFVTLLPFMQKFGGYANLTAKAFNQMSQAARGDVLKKALASPGVAQMIAAMEKTFDAAWGATKSIAKELTRLGTKPLFEGMTRGLMAMNKSFISANGELTPLSLKIIGIGETISRAIVAGMEKSVAAARLFYGWINKAIGRLHEMGEGFTLGNVLGAGAGAAGLAAGLGGPITVGLMALADFATRTEAVAGVMAELSNTMDILLVPFTAMGHAAMTVSGMLGDILEGALGGFISMVNDVLSPVFNFLGGVVNETISLFNALRPTLMAVWKATGNLFTAIGKFLNPVIRILSSVFLKMYNILWRELVPWFNVLIGIVKQLFNELSELLTWLGGWLGKAADKTEEMLGTKPHPAGDRGAPRDFISEFFDQFQTKMKQPDESLLGVTATGPKTPRTRGGTVQDFRFSRFEITQKFAEGFDPDRIAVMFARDVGRIGEQSLQSGFEPLFAIS